MFANVKPNHKTKIVTIKSTFGVFLLIVLDDKSKFMNVYFDECKR